MIRPRVQQAELEAEGQKLIDFFSSRSEQDKALLQDARIDVPEGTEVALLGRYVRSRRAADGSFDGAEFIKLYVTLAAQRNSKILGIFARLDLRDGKPQYLRHMPRVWAYLQRSLAHPALAALNEWYTEHVPALKTI